MVVATKTYRGERTPDGCVVTVNGEPLDPRFDLARFAAGFEWGYDGTGPRQLALALLADHTGQGEKAVSGCRALVQALVETWETDTWTITGDDIDKSLQGFTQVPTDLAGLLARIRGES
jgi:hypothetical protein